MDLIKDINELVPLGKPTAETSLEEERLLEESTREIGASKDVPLDVSSNYQIPPSLRVDLTQLEMDLNMELGREQKGAMEEDTAEEEEEDTATDGDRKISAVDTTREKEALMERVRGLETASDVTNSYNVAIRDGMHLELINKADLKCVRDNAGSLAFMKATSGLETAQAAAKAARKAKMAAADTGLGASGISGPGWTPCFTLLPPGTSKVGNKRGSDLGYVNDVIMYPCAHQATEECVSRRSKKPLFWRYTFKAFSGCPACRNYVLDAHIHEDGTKMCRNGTGSTEYIAHSATNKWTTVQGILSPPDRLLANEDKLRYNEKQRELSSRRTVGFLTKSGDHDGVARLRAIHSRCGQKQKSKKDAMLKKITAGIKSNAPVDGIIPDELKDTVTLSSIGGTLKQLFRLYGVEIFALLYIGKLTPEFGSNGKLEIPLFHKELVGSTCGSSRKTALLDENQGRLSKKSLLRFTLTAAPRSIPVDKLGVVALRMATETQPEAFDRELELIKSVPQLRREVGNGRLVCINEQKDKVGSTAQDKEGKPDPNKVGGVFATIFLLRQRSLETGIFSFNADRSAKHQRDVAAQLPQGVSYYKRYARSMSEKAKKSAGRSNEGQKKRKAAKRDAEAKRAKSHLDKMNGANQK